MSRVGRKAIPIPKDVKVQIEGTSLQVQGPKGKLTTPVPPGISFKLENGELLAARSNDERQQRAFHGLARALANNAVRGVTEGFSKELDIVGVGFKAAVEDHGLDALVLGPGGDELSDLLRRLHVRAPLGPVALELLVERGGGAQRPPGLVVDHLGVDVALAAEYGQPRPRRRPRHPLADATVDPVPDVFLRLDLHDYFAPAPVPVAPAFPAFFFRRSPT